MPGPVPKRSDQRRRANKPEIDVDHAPAGADVEWPDPDERWNPIAKAYFESLQASGQSAFYEQSDVATAYYVTEAMSRSLASPTRISGQLFSAVLTGTGLLLSTEGDRRRLRIELARADSGPTDSEIAATADMANYRKKLA